MSASGKMPDAGNWVLHGNKVTLRPFTEQDITGAYIGWLNNPLVTRLSNQRFRKHDAQSSLVYLRSFEGTDNLFVSVTLNASGQAIGTLTAYVSRPHGTADVGIMMGEPAAWGQGLGQDAWNTLCTWLLTERGVRKLTAGTLDCNFGMIRIMERSGMQLEGVRRAQEMVDGQPYDVLYYARFANV